MAPGGVGRTPKPKTGYPDQAAEVEHIPFFWDAARTENAQCSKWFPPGWVCTLQQVPPRRHLQKLFIFEIEFRFTFLGQKSQKVDLKVPFSFSKNSIIFNDLLAGFLSINLRIFFVFNLIEIIFDFFWNKFFFLKKNLIPLWATTVIWISKQSLKIKFCGIN